MIFFNCAEHLYVLVKSHLVLNPVPDPDIAKNLIRIRILIKVRAIGSETHITSTVEYLKRLHSLNMGFFEENIQK